MTSPEPTRAVYVRMPARVAEKLDRASARLGMPKRAVLAALISDNLDVDDEDLVIRVPADPPPKQPPADEEDTEPGGAVLNLGQAARLLHVPEADLEPLARSGQVPARRIGDQWRFSRSALLRWLGGD